MPTAYINRIGTAVPPYDVHRKFTDYAPRLLKEERSKRLFRRMAERAQIEHRYSYFEPHPSSDQLDRGGFYRHGRFPDTQARMQFYEDHTFDLARGALEDVNLDAVKEDITHLIVASCTGFYAPGLELAIMRHFGLRPTIERTLVGFMGCYAAMNALKLARHIVRSEPDARVLVLNIELCTLHLQEIDDLERVLAFLIFADGCAACVVSGEPRGIELQSFNSTVLPNSSRQMSWRIGQAGFDMHLAGRVPHTIARELPRHAQAILDGRRKRDIALWAVHPGGRSVLDAVELALGLDDDDLRYSREILRRFGNMSSASVMFILKRMLEDAPPGEPGCALAFGPGLVAETALFRMTD